MLKTIIIAENVLEPDTWESVEVEDVCAFLTERWAKWPASGHIYHEQVAESHDVTPNDDAGVDKLQGLEGTFYIVIFPEGPLVAFLPYIIMAIVAVAAMIFLKPKIPSTAQRNQNDNSPNNELSERVNNARPKARIPDIYGTVRSTPDLIALPYTQYVNNQEVEDCLMCIGRGQYNIIDCYDGETRVKDIPGMTVQVYNPNTSYNFDEPFYRIGNSITTDFSQNAIYARDVVKSSSVTGQTLGVPNTSTWSGSNNVYFQAPNAIYTPGVDLTTLFMENDTVTLSNTVISAGNTSVTVPMRIYAGSSFCYQIPSSSNPNDFVVGQVITIPATALTIVDTTGGGGG